ncbi:unnamed protein product [Sphagnum jensenii]|uniref:Uncharacterized protein n=1 Tax=Sphagnum jensenii TaxID=128206 RepID=A0ABP1BQR3_9BRYO
MQQKRWQEECNNRKSAAGRKQQTNAGRVQQKENTTEVAGRMQQQLQEEGCVEKGERANNATETAERMKCLRWKRVENNAIEKIRHKSIQQQCMWMHVDL